MPIKQSTYRLIRGVIAIILVVAIFVAVANRQEQGDDQLVRQDGQEQEQAPLTGEVVVESPIVKVEEASCKYFFVIRNYTNYPYSGSTEIVLYTGEQLLASGTFTTRGKPLQPTVGLAKWITLDSCEPRAEAYTYRIFSGEELINEGRELVSDKTNRQ